MMHTAMHAIQTLPGAAVMFAASGPFWGKAAFIGVYVLLLIWLCWMPARLIGRADARPPWWRNTRFWAIVVTVTQILVYLRWG